MHPELEAMMRTASGITDRLQSCHGNAASWPDADVAAASRKSVTDDGRAMTARWFGGD